MFRMVFTLCIFSVLLYTAYGTRLLNKNAKVEPAGKIIKQLFKKIYLPSQLLVSLLHKKIFIPDPVYLTRYMCTQIPINSNNIFPQTNFRSAPYYTVLHVSLASHQCTAHKHTQTHALRLIYSQRVHQIKVSLLVPLGRNYLSMFLKVITVENNSTLWWLISEINCST